MCNGDVVRFLGGTSRIVKLRSDEKRFRASEFISHRFHIDTVEEAEKAARNITASVALAYRLSTRKLTFLEISNELPGLDHLLQLKQRLRKFCMKSGIRDVKRHLTGSPRQSAE
jgi:hypothetical protein